MALLRRHWRLHNGEDIEALPAALVRARGNRTARALAQSDWLLRRKEDGRFLAGFRAGDARLHGLGPEARPHSEALHGMALHLLAADAWRGPADESALPTTRLEQALAELAVPADYGDRHDLALVPEPASLAFAGHDRYLRPLWLLAGAARAWARMRAAALAEGVVLEAISGYRSHAYQLGIFRRKQARGQHVEDILRVNAAPGYSEHHSGRALDIGTPGEPPAEESFERTPAFDWLTRRAGGFGFVMSYPRGNPHGIVYEPWHWCWGGEG